MTVVVGFYCSDGVVIAADSMITPTIGNIGVGHHHGQKIFARNNHQLYAFAGDQGMALRGLYVVEHNIPNPNLRGHPLLYAHDIFAATQALLAQTGIALAQPNLNLTTMLAFDFNNTHQCCFFGMGGGFQPMLLDLNNYFLAMGSGKQFADPFLRFVADTFCPNGHPTVSEARFLAAWVVKHVIDTNPGGVAGPIRMGMLARGSDQRLTATELPDDDIQEHLEAVNEAGEILRAWRSGQLATSVSPPSIPTP